MNSVEEFREKAEELDVLQMAIPVKEKQVRDWPASQPRPTSTPHSKQGQPAVARRRRMLTHVFGVLSVWRAGCDPSLCSLLRA